MNCFEDKVTVITGAGSGIGRALARQLAVRRARLALSDVNARSLAETRKSLAKGTKAIAYTLDVSSREAVFAHAEAVPEDTQAIDRLIDRFPQRPRIAGDRSMGQIQSAGIAMTRK